MQPEHVQLAAWSVRLLSGQSRKSATSVRNPVSSHLAVLLREPRPHYASKFCEGQESERTEVYLIRDVYETPEKGSETVALWHPGH